MSLNLYIPPSRGAGQTRPLASLVNLATESYKSRKKLMVVGQTNLPGIPTSGHEEDGNTPARQKSSGKSASDLN
ncbi:hypothetical protein ANO14919_058180 [Xylariales sp. No.14919]|nr:hypothetical protein ANO14919_058180 [Xylariales sp. No.14919]